MPPLLCRYDAVALSGCIFPQHHRALSRDMQVTIFYFVSNSVITGYGIVAGKMAPLRIFCRIFLILAPVLYRQT